MPIIMPINNNTEQVKALCLGGAAGVSSIYLAYHAAQKSKNPDLGLLITNVVLIASLAGSLTGPILLKRACQGFAGAAYLVAAVTAHKYNSISNQVADLGKNLPLSTIQALSASIKPLHSSLLNLGTLLKI